MGKSHLVPFLPEARLRELGGLYEKVGASHGAFNNVHRRPLSTDFGQYREGTALSSCQELDFPFRGADLP